MPSPAERIIFVTAAQTPWGAEHSLAILCRELQEFANPVVICASRKTEQFLMERGVRDVERIDAGRSRLGTLFRFAHRLGRGRLRGVVVIFSLQLAPLAVMMRLNPLEQRRTVVDLHDVPKGRLDRLATLICVWFANRSISISRYVSSSLGLGDRDRVVPRPVDVTNGPTATSKHSDELVVGIVGRIDPEKRLEVAVRALALADKRVILRVFGAPMLESPGYAESIQRLADELVPGRVEFMGSLPPDRIYPGLDAVIVCNENEPSGRTVGEAMSWGVLPIVPDRGGSPEYLPRELRWLTYRALSPESAANTITELLRRSPDEILTDRAIAEEVIRRSRSAQAIARQYAEALSVASSSVDEGALVPHHSVTVVIPTIGRESLRRSVASALNQTTPPLEVIVCADTDLPLDLPEDARVRVLRVGPRAGGNVARNAGAQAAFGDLIALLDDDDVWDPNFLEVMHARVGALGVHRPWLFSSRVRNPRGRVYPKRVMESEDELLDYMMVLHGGPLGKGALMTPTLAFPAWLMREVPWRSEQRFHQDMTWIIDLKKRFPQLLVAQVADPLVVLGDPPRSVSKSIPVEESVQWAREHVLNSGLSRASHAFADFLLSRYPGRTAMGQRDWSAARVVARTARLEGKPSVWAWSYFLAMGVRSLTVRRQVRTGGHPPLHGRGTR